MPKRGAKGTQPQCKKPSFATRYMPNGKRATMFGRLHLTETSHLASRLSKIVTQLSDQKVRQYIERLLRLHLRHNRKTGNYRTGGLTIIQQSIRRNAIFPYGRKNVPAEGLKSNDRFGLEEERKEKTKKNKQLRAEEQETRSFSHYNYV